MMWSGSQSNTRGWYTITGGTSISLVGTDGRCLSLCNHVECNRARTWAPSLSGYTIKSADADLGRDRFGKPLLSLALRAAMPAPPPPTRAPVPRAHDKRMGFADAPRRPCYRGAGARRA